LKIRGNRQKKNASLDIDLIYNGLIVLLWKNEDMKHQVIKLERNRSRIRGTCITDLWKIAKIAIIRTMAWSISGY
jgi:hypothetical protein